MPKKNAKCKFSIEPSFKRQKNSGATLFAMKIMGQVH